MLTITDYLERAKRLHSLRSDRQLSLALGHTYPSKINFWRQGSVPEADELLRLAEMAGIDAEHAMADWGRWKVESKGQARAAEVFKDMSRKLAAVSCLAFLLLTGIAPAPAGERQRNTVTGGSSAMYIMGSFAKRWRRYVLGEPRGCYI